MGLRAGCCTSGAKPQPPQTFYFTFIVLQTGEHTLGSQADEPQRITLEGREPRHQVTVTRPFALVDREVTMIA